jgi:hypothetical protein
MSQILPFLVAIGLIKMIFIVINHVEPHLPTQPTSRIPLQILKNSIAKKRTFMRGAAGEFGIV